MCQNLKFGNSDFRVSVDFCLKCCDVKRGGGVNVNVIANDVNFSTRTLDKPPNKEFNLEHSPLDQETVY